ncbi:MAG: hypothetical protein KGK35_09005, partial [Xanthomonadaceae bacterium]|nr:hypothetical protein [Xanthomonadaceae bacterium]
MLIDAMRAAARDGRPAALATITATRGATFRRAGARMLVGADGNGVCELSGGCPQRDIVQRAQQAIVSGRPELACYNADSGLDVLMEMGCGGELEILIEPLSPRSATDFADSLATCLGQRIDARLATIFAIDGRVIAPQRMVWCAARTLFDDSGDEAVSRIVAD